MLLRFSALLLLSIFILLNSGNAQTYKGTQDGKALRSWYVAGPLKISNDSTSPDNTAQENFFKRDNNQNIEVRFKVPHEGAGADLKNWKQISWSTDVIDFDSIFKHPDYVSAYAYAVVISDAAKSALLGVGSDDAVKVWVNGKLVHKNWAARGVVVDNDAIPVNLIKGKNEILLEVQDLAGGWGFTARFLDKKAVTQKLVRAAALGNIDEVNQMLSAGAEVNGKGDQGVTALDVARISGREEIEKILVSKGASGNVPSAEILVDGVYSKVNEKSKPGISMLVAKDGKIIYEKGFGYADIDKKTKITPETKFRIGSITKQFIGSSILKLQEDGKISVKDKLTKFFPDFPRGNEVTIHHLLTHTSGIHSFTNKDNFLVDVLKPVTNEQLLNYFKNDPYDFNPGEQYQYNNSGYFLLGYIIEKITGDSYGNYLKKHFFDPLQMTNTGVHTPKLKLTNEAFGYQAEGETYKRALDWNMDWAGGAGSLYSTVEDLYKWNEGIFNNKVLKTESIKAAFTPVLLNDGKEPAGTKYGYGWALGDYRNVASIGHSGGLHGFIAQLLRVPKENMTIVMLTNVLPPQVELDPMKIAELYMWKDLPKQSSNKQAEVEEKDLDKYTGRYDFTNGAVMLISKEKDGLYAQLSGQPKFPIFPSAPGKYFWKVVDAKIEFISDTLGNVTHGKFEQGSAKMDVPKMKDLQIVQPDTTQFELYKGSYKYMEQVNIDISTANGKLYAQATGQSRYELLALSDTEFHIKELNATLLFKKDATGKVNTVTVKLASDVREAVRIQQ